MNQPRMKTRGTASFAWILLACMLAFACGGGGGERIIVTPSGLTVTFVPDATPGPMSLSIAPGASTGALFDLQILVTEIDDFFGAGFRVYFDPALFDYTGMSSVGSFINETGVVTVFDAPEVEVGEIWIHATRQGQFVGVPASASPELLITLSFEAGGATAGSRFSFDTPGGDPDLHREVETCESATPGGPACVFVDDGDLTWIGGTLIAN